MARVIVEQFREYPDGGEIESGVVGQGVLTGRRVFPMPMPERSVCLRVGKGKVDLTREGALEIANALREAALDG